jgi:hypothetical protein
VRDAALIGNDRIGHSHLTACASVCIAIRPVPDFENAVDALNRQRIAVTIDGVPVTRSAVLGNPANQRARFGSLLIAGSA